MITRPNKTTKMTAKRLLQRAKPIIRWTHRISNHVNSATRGQRVAPAAFSPASSSPATASEPQPSAMPAGSPWIWPSRVPLGAVSVLVGQAGAVTSLVGSTIVATVVNGGDWPNSEGRAHSGSVIVAAPDDVLKATTVPQLNVVGALLPSVIFMPWNSLAGTAFGVMQQLAFRIRGIANPRMIVVHWNFDQVDEDYVKALDELNHLAKACGVAVIVVAHVNGLTESKRLRAALEMFAGSAAVSSVFHVAVDYESGRHLFLPVKNVLGYETMGHAFHVQPRLSSAGVPSAVLEWDPLPVGQEPIRRQRSDRKKGEKERAAADFVREQLGNGAMPGKELTERAVGDGIKEITLRRAVEKLGVVRSAGIWSLPTTEGVVGSNDHAA
jgi:hypothetical protein